MRRASRPPNIIRAIAVLLASCACASAPAEEPWTLARNADGIVVYTRHVADSPLKAFRAEVEVATSVERVLDVLRDPDTFPDWLPDVAECRVVRTTDSERYLYVDTKAPWPVSNRDGVFHFTFEDRAGGAAATVRVEAVPGEAPPREGHVRVPRSDGYWRIDPKGDGVVVSYEIHADPGGWVPAWLANITVVRMPFRTLEGLRRHLLSPTPKRPGCPASPASPS